MQEAGSTVNVQARVGSSAIGVELGWWEEIIMEHPELAEPLEPTPELEDFCSRPCSTGGEVEGVTGTSFVSVMEFDTDATVHAAKLQRAWRAHRLRRTVLLNSARRIQALWRGYSTRNLHLVEHFRSASRQRRAGKQSQMRRKHRKLVAGIARAGELRFVGRLVSTCSPCAKMAEAQQVREIVVGTRVEVFSPADTLDDTGSNCDGEQDDAINIDHTGCLSRCGKVLAVHNAAEIEVWNFFSQ